MDGWTLHQFDSWRRKRMCSPQLREGGVPRRTVANATVQSLVRGGLLEQLPVKMGEMWVQYTLTDAGRAAIGEQA